MTTSLGVAGPEVDDAALIRLSQDDPDYFTGIYDRYFAQIHAYVAGRLGPQVAQDVASETFLDAFRNRGRFDPEKGSVRPWLYGFAANLIRRHRRTEERRYRALGRFGGRAETQAPGHEERVVDQVDAMADNALLARELRRLSRGDRDVLLMVALADLSHAEVAEALGIPYGTVGSRLSRARRKLRSVMGARVPGGSEDE